MVIRMYEHNKESWDHKKPQLGTQFLSRSRNVPQYQGFVQMFITVWFKRNSSSFLTRKNSHEQVNHDRFTRMVHWYNKNNPIRTRGDIHYWNVVVFKSKPHSKLKSSKLFRVPHWNSKITKLKPHKKEGLIDRSGRNIDLFVVGKNVTEIAPVR